MKKRNANSLTTHIWSILISLIFVLFLCLFFFHNIFYLEFYDFFKRQELTKIGKEINLIIEDEDVYSKLQTLSINENLTIAIFTNNNGIEELYNSTDVLNLSVYYDIIENSGKDADIFRDVLSETHEVYVYISKLTINNEVYYVYINTPIEVSNFSLAINKYLIIISAIITMIFGILIAFFFSSYLSKPIKDLNNAAFLLSNGNYDVTFPDEGFDELRELGNSLNKAKDELKKTDTLQKEFIANVSHDLRTPLTLILSYAEMIKEISGDNKEKREEHLDVIISEVNRLSSLVTDVLEISKLKANQNELNLKEVNISNLVLSVLDKVKLPLSENKIKLSTNLDKKAFALIDEISFNQVVYNFILNAITYTNNKIIVNVEVVDKNIIFSVVDNGIGIKEEEKNQIWERYYRSEENHERHKHGSGLGLSIVKKILENHKFEYGVESIYEEGSKFYVIIPLL